MSDTEVRYDSDQQKVVDWREGPLLVMAGAGSGKTRSIVGRTTAMIKEGIPPDEQLLLTFSNKAAAEMRERIDAAFPRPPAEAGKPKAHRASSGLTVSTFHSFGSYLIRMFPQFFARTGKEDDPNGQGPTLMDDKQQVKALAEVLALRMGVDAKASKFPVKEWMQFYNQCRGDLVHVFNSRNAGMFGERFQLMEPGAEQDRISFAWNLFVEYERYKQNRNLLDYDDLLLLPVLGLSRQVPENRALLESLRNIYRFITVDEVQDTNKVQYALIRLIGAHGNVVLVGDDDQGIYSWRGARIDNLYQFRDENRAAVVTLTRNYRSTRAIVSAAGKCIAHNRKRVEKNPVAVGAAGEAPVVYEHRNSYGAADAIADKIEDALRAGYRPRDIAVLYRMNALARPLEGAMLARNIPYQIAGGLSFSERSEIMLAIAAARLVCNPLDSHAFQRVAKEMPGFGQTSVDKVLAEADATGKPLVECGSALGNKARSSLENLAVKLDNLREMGARNLGAWVMSDVGFDYEAHMEEAVRKGKQTEEQAQVRLRNLGLLDTWMSAWVDRAEEDGIQDAWRILFDHMLSDPTDEDDRDAVRLSTVHKAKGLEWKDVHLFGVSQGIMPLERTMADADKGDAPEGQEARAEGIEEERRLLYVAATRARDRLFVHHADCVDLGYDKKNVSPSSYIAEMGLSIPKKRAPFPAFMRSRS